MEAVSRPVSTGKSDSLRFQAFRGAYVPQHNVGMTVVYRDYRSQDIHVSFRANDALVTALNDRARKTGCSTSEYLRSLVREKISL
jgi:hypothetical protein